MTKKTGTELTEAQTTEVSTDVVNDSEWGGVEVSRTDLRIPKLLLMQGTSVLVSESKAMVGQIIDSSTGEKVADYDTKIKILPFLCRKEYVVSKLIDGSFKYDHTDEVKGEFTRPYEEDKFGDKFKNERQYSFYVLTEQGGLPLVVSFKGKSLKVGQQLFTKMYVQNKAQRPQLPPASNWITITSKKEKNDKGPYAVWSIGMERRTTSEELMTCKEWIGTILSSTLIVEEDTTSDDPKNYADENTVF